MIGIDIQYAEWARNVIKVPVLRHGYNMIRSQTFEIVQPKSDSYSTWLRHVQRVTTLQKTLQNDTNAIISKAPGKGLERQTESPKSCKILNLSYIL